MKFQELDLHPQILKNLEAVQFVECTPIQKAAIPEILQGRDLAGLAQTGTGKTGAFLIPIIDRILKGMEATPQTVPGHPSAPGVEVADETEAHPKDVESLQAAPEKTEPPGRFFKDWRRRHFILVLVPTRELAEQVYENAQKWLKGTSLKAVAVYGGTTYEKQKAAFKDGVEIVIATPGRLIDLYKEHFVDLKQVRAVVFDEADRMFDMGFKDDMKFVLRRIPRERQFLVFSATLNFDVLNVAYEFGAFPVEINVSKDQPKAENVEDTLFHVGQDDKGRYLLSLLLRHSPKQTIIFSNFKHNVERIARFLNNNGLPAVGISSLLTQAQRNRVMEQFKAANDRNILVATDVAARGLDILGVDLVVNYELPDDPENYVHRIGRTGRAGAKGLAISLCSDRDVDALARIEDYLGHKVTTGWLDDVELVTEFKEFPREMGRESREPRAGGFSAGGRSGGAPRRDAGGGRGDARAEGRVRSNESQGRGGRGGEGRSRGGEHRGRSAEGRRRGPEVGEMRNERTSRQEGRGDGRRQRTGAPEGGPRVRSDQRSANEARTAQGRSDHRSPQRRDNRPHAPRSRPGPSGLGRQGGPSQRGGSQPRQGAASAAATAAAKQQGLGAKVTGFFRRLIGKE